MRAGRPRERERVARRYADVGAGERLRGNADDAAHDIEGDDADRDEHDRREEPATQELEDRKREEVEADVAAEDRIRRAERHAVQPTEKGVPLVSAGEAEEERRDEQERHQPRGEGERTGALRRVGVDHEARHLWP